MSCRVNFHAVRSALQYSGCGNFICLLFIFADQVFIDPTFSDIFVCGPLQSFVVNVCTRILIFFLSIKAWEEKSLPKSHLGWFFSVFGEVFGSFEIHLTFDTIFVPRLPGFQVCCIVGYTLANKMIPL